MNERIKELAEQARFAMEVSNDPNSPPSWWGAGHNDTFERFAELIVNECIDSCLKVDNIRNIVPPTQDQVILWCVDEIQKKFGVE